MSKRKYGRRRRNNSLTGVIVFIAAAGILAILSTTVFFNVENITVTGSSNYTAQEIIDASGIKAGDNLVRTNTKKCAKQIESQLVYIETAVITRAFPNTMVIEVAASEPAANFIEGNKTLLISTGGKVLDNLTEPKAGLLNFTGTSPNPSLLPGDKFESDDSHKTDAINKLMNYFNEKDSSHITLIDVSNYAAISYTHDNRIVVELGTVNDLEYKINFSQEIINQKIGEKTEGVLTILSDSNRASFLDKESLEHNAKVYNDNIAALNKETSETAEDDEEASETEATEIIPIME